MDVPVERNDNTMDEGESIASPMMNSEESYLVSQFLSGHFDSVDGVDGSGGLHTSPPQDFENDLRKNALDILGSYSSLAYSFIVCEGSSLAMVVSDTVNERTVDLVFGVDKELNQRVVKVLVRIRQSLEKILGSVII